mgnify:CR=1 FL=1
MGIKNFSQFLKKNGHKIKELKLSDEHKNITIAADASIMIHQVSSSMKYTNLTDSKGNDTTAINAILQKIVNLIVKFGAPNIVWIFDSKIPHRLKLNELKKRKKNKERSIKKLQDKKTEDKKYKEKLKKINFKITDKLLTDIKTLLTMLCVTIVDSPDGYDAEHYAACLNKRGLIDYFITTDTDYLVFGGNGMLVPIKKKKNLYNVFNHFDILKALEINNDELITCSVMLGSDYAPKAKGIGPATVKKKVDIYSPTSEQKEAIELFKEDCYYNESINLKNKKINKELLIKWLLDKNFNEKRVLKIMSLI